MKNKLLKYLLAGGLVLVLSFGITTLQADCGGCKEKEGHHSDEKSEAGQSGCGEKFSDKKSECSHCGHKKGKGKKGKRFRKAMKKHMLPLYDKDKDGELSKEEKKTLRSDMKKFHQEKHKALGIKKGDKKAIKKMRKAKRKEHIKKYDKDKDGKLDAKEFEEVAKEKAKEFKAWKAKQK